MSLTSLLKQFIPERLQGPLKESAYGLIANFYRGDRYECVFCGGKFSRLIPRGLKHGILVEKHVVGGGIRPNAFCPGCLSYDRERLVFLYLKGQTDFLTRAGLRILHIAPERQLEKVFRKLPGVKYLSADLMSEAVDVKADVTQLQFEDNSFDLILCNHVMEHVPDDRKAMSELFRVLAPGGLAIIQTPISTLLEKTKEGCDIKNESDREREYGQKDHCRIYAMDYENRLKESGFTVDAFRWESTPENFGGRDNLFALNPEERVFACRKGA